MKVLLVNGSFMPIVLQPIGIRFTVRSRNRFQRTGRGL